MSHTPGPWKVDTWKYQDYRGEVLAITTDKDAICQINGLYRPLKDYNKSVELETKERTANARLIAAAPELLDACLDAKQRIQMDLKFLATHAQEDAKEYIKMLDIVIAKATGE